MTDTQPEQQPETVEQHPDYLSLPQTDRDEIDTMVSSTQEMQNEVDKWCGIMGSPTFFLARLLLQHELSIRTLRRENRELLMRLRALEDKVS